MKDVQVALSIGGDAYGKTLAGLNEVSALTSELIDCARRDERRRIAAEIHDDTIQTIVATGLALARLGRKYPDPEIAEIEVRVRSAVRSLRQFVFELEPDVCGTDLVGSLCGYLERSLGAEIVELKITNDLLEWPRGAALSVLFRNCREATLNAVRHGGATSVEITLSVVNTMLVARIVDNGAGCQPDAEVGAGHRGLRYMRRRAEDEGGTFSFVSMPGFGAIVGFSLRGGDESGLANVRSSGTAVAHSFGVLAR